MTDLLTITVQGTPAPQGSKSARAIYRGRGEQRQFTGKVAMHESSKKVEPWRQAVKAAALDAASLIPDWTPLDELVEISVIFYFDRPAYHFGTGRNAHLLKPGAPDFVGVYPDLDKLLRSTLDGLGSKTGAGVIRNDSQVVRFTEVDKRYVTPGHRQAGAVITIRPLNAVAAPLPPGAAESAPYPLKGAATAPTSTQEALL